MFLYGLFFVVVICYVLCVEHIHSVQRLLLTLDLGINPGSSQGTTCNAICMQESSLRNYSSNL